MCEEFSLAWGGRVFALSLREVISKALCCPAGGSVLFAGGFGHWTIQWCDL